MSSSIPNQSTTKSRDLKIKKNVNFHTADIDKIILQQRAVILYNDFLNITLPCMDYIMMFGSSALCQFLCTAENGRADLLWNH